MVHTKAHQICCTAAGVAGGAEGEMVATGEVAGGREGVALGEGGDGAREVACSSGGCIARSVVQMGVRVAGKGAWQR